MIEYNLVGEKIINIGGRIIGPKYPPLVIPEIGINHEGDINKAFKMVDDAFGAGAECVKFQSHIVEDEMIYNDVVPANADESIWQIMSRCALTEEEDFKLKEYVESKGMIYLCTPFSSFSPNKNVYFKQNITNIVNKLKKYT